MIDKALRVLTVRDFRSIRGETVIPLAAPVVLLHGKNGAGKTSVISALELALTAEVTGIAQLDPQQLVHRGADRSEIQLLTSDGDINLSVEGRNIVGDPLLGPTDARFFSHRCYLQQQTLGHLLQDYEEDEGTDESALTTFVHELLGVDSLDSLVDGLHPAGDKRRLKKLVPDYDDIEREQERRDKQLRELQAELRTIDSTVSQGRVQLSSLLRGLDASPALEDDIQAANVWLTEANASEERRLVDLLSVRRELSVLNERAQTLVQRPEANALAALERQAALARQAAEEWRTQYGAPLEAILGELRTRLPGVPSAVGATDPAATFATAYQQTATEISRLDTALQTHEHASARTEQLVAGEANTRARLTAISQRLAEAPPTTQAEDLAKALAALIPHVHSEVCPVCGRDYSDVGHEPLATYLAGQVAELSSRAEQLQELTTASSAAAAELARSEAERDELSRQLMRPDAKVSAQQARAALADAHQRLSKLEPGIQRGGALLRAQTETERDLARARERDTVAADLRGAVQAQATALGQVPVAPATPTETALASLIDLAASRIAALEQRAQRRAEALSAVRDLLPMLRRKDELSQEREGLAAERLRVAGALSELDRRRSIARKVHQAAAEARIQIVQQVFTNSLNRVWRDLFVRLAPEEPFVPRFRVPQAGEGVIATLETVHRDGKPGGPPAVMLSSGNLNTAALTLFLALNLSVEPRLQWLILDDPVQSMDEVHVSQFAALLRTLTREHQRRVVIAVHDRALFDYLRLELSPAGREESLQTIELTRGPDGTTKSDPDYQGYIEDRALELA